MYSRPVTPCSDSDASVSLEIGVVRIDVGDDLHAVRGASVDADGHHPAHFHAEVTHRAAAVQARDAAFEVDLVAPVVARIAAARVPVHEQAGHRDDEQHEGADGGVVSFTFHDCPFPGRSAERARRGNRPGSTDVDCA